MQTIEIPSESNIYKIIGKKGEPLQTDTVPFNFFYEDECGNDTVLDITGYEFTLYVYFNNCLMLESTDLVKEAPNELFINIPSIDLNKGQYDYFIKINGGNSVIQGKLIVNE